jgi:hypothetical protein
VPVFKHRVDIAVRNLKAFLNLEVGMSRGRASTPLSIRWESGKTGDVRILGQPPRAVAADMIASPSPGIRPANLVWIFGAARTGSTWLSRMMGEMDGQTVWNEPLVGALFGNLYYDRAKHLIGKQGKHYILGDGYRDSWMGSIRDLTLKEASDRFPKAKGKDRYLVIKEPNGSLGAPLLMEALPESRLILLVRDPRDAIASSMDAKREGGWQYENRKGTDGSASSPVDRNPNGYVRDRANSYLERIINSKQAYDDHNGPKTMLRYEDLRADALGVMRRIYSDLGIPVDDDELRRSVQKHDWENIPEEQKGEGKVFRKARPGGWQDDLTPQQVKIVEQVTAPILEEFYSVPAGGARG